MKCGAVTRPAPTGGQHRHFRRRAGRAPGRDSAHTWSLRSSWQLILLAINTFLYPYARFVYESVVGFITGNDVFFVNAGLMISIKLMTMALCWCAAIFIAPVGLAYLYYHHGKSER